MKTFPLALTLIAASGGLLYAANKSFLETQQTISTLTTVVQTTIPETTVPETIAPQPSTTIKIKRKNVAPTTTHIPSPVNLEQPVTTTSSTPQPIVIQPTTSTTTIPKTSTTERDDD